MAPLMSTVTLWFEQRRALAISLVSSGIGVAPLTISPAASWLVVEYGWRDTQFVLGAVCLLLLLPAAWLIQRPASATAGQTDGISGNDFRVMTVSAFRSKAFALLALTSLASCGTHSGPIFHTVSFAVGCGLPLTTAVTIYSVEGFAGLVGRIVFGLTADRYGVLKMFIVGLLMQAFAAGAYSITSQLGTFYGVAFVFGMAYGGVMPLFVSLVRSYFPPQIMGTMLGTLSFASSIGMVSGPAIGGWIYDNYHAYTWLYLGSLIVGLCAVLTSLALPRPVVETDAVTRLGA
jgi:MFS family permease